MRRLAETDDILSTGTALRAAFDQEALRVKRRVTRLTRSRNAAIHGGPLSDATCDTIAEFATTLGRRALTTTIWAIATGRSVEAHATSRRDEFRQRALELTQAVISRICSASPPRRLRLNHSPPGELRQADDFAASVEVGFVGRGIPWLIARVANLSPTSLSQPDGGGRRYRRWSRPMPLPINVRCMRGWIAGIAGVALLAGCSVNGGGALVAGTSDTATTVGATDASTVPAAPPSRQPVHLGATVEVAVETDMTDGSTVRGRAAFTVSNLRPITPAYGTDDDGGSFYAVDVTIEALSGTIVVHPFNFAVRTEDGTNLNPELSAIKNGLPATDLPEGQKLSGRIAVDVPAGKAVAEIIAFSQIGGTQLGRWTVP